MLFPEKTSSTPPDANDIARHIRDGLEAEEVVDLWNVVFPEDRNVWYDEEAKEIRFNTSVKTSHEPGQSSLNFVRQAFQPDRSANAAFALRKAVVGAAGCQM